MSRKIVVYRSHAKNGAIKAVRPSTMAMSAHSTRCIPRHGGIVVRRVSEAEYLRRMVVDGHRFEASRHS